MYKFISKSEEDTINFANDFAKNLKVMLQQHHINPICQNFVALRKSVFRKQIFRMYRNIISICKKR